MTVSGLFLNTNTNSCHPFLFCTMMQKWCACKELFFFFFKKEACHCCNSQMIKDRDNKWTWADPTMLRGWHYFLIAAPHCLLLCNKYKRQLAHQILVFECSWVVLLDKQSNNKGDIILYMYFTLSNLMKSCSSEAWYILLFYSLGATDLKDLE